jgi:serine protease
MNRRSILAVFLMLFFAGVAAAQRPDFAADHYFVGFRTNVGPRDEDLLRAQGLQIGRAFHEVRAVEIIARNANQISAIQRNPRVEYVEQVPMRYPVSLSDGQLTPTTSNGLYGLINVKATDAHASGWTGNNVDVGVADTAIDCGHPDIAANLVRTYDAVGNGSHTACWKTSDGEAETHATHVAGTIIGVNNNQGIYGVAYNARLHHARVLGPDGGTTADIMEGVRWLVETEKVRVVNLSLGGRFSSRTEENFYKEMNRKGVLVVAATGNDGSSRLSYPAGYTVNIAVGAVDRNNARASFSNTGQNIDVVGPGVAVLSSVPANQGSEASVSTISTYTAFGLEYAGRTNSNGVSAALVNCGLAKTTNDCTASVFGKVALIQRGDISFADKVTNVMTAGAIAAIIYNNAAGDFQGTLGGETNANGQPWIPAVAVSDATGAILHGQLGSSAKVENAPTSWDTYDGTSMATPHVTGVIALMWGANPALTNSTIQSYLFSSCTDLGVAGYDKSYGYGIINALKAIQKATGQIP